MTSGLDSFELCVVKMWKEQIDWLITLFFDYTAMRKWSINKLLTTKGGTFVQVQSLEYFERSIKLARPMKNVSPLETV